MRHFKFYYKIVQVLGLGDEAGDCSSTYLVKFILGREVFYGLLPEFQVRHEGFFLLTQ